MEKFIREERLAKEGRQRGFGKGKRRGIDKRGVEGISEGEGGK